MKTISLLIIGVLMIALCTTTGCLKCECCGPYAGPITFIKGADTIMRQYGGVSYFILNDTLNFYNNLGYTSSMTGGPYYYDAQQTCGPIKIKQQKQMGYECQEDQDIRYGHCF